MIDGSTTTMKIRVPQAFAASIRHNRLTALSILSIVSFLLAFFYKSEFQYAGYPLVAYMLVILATYRQPLMYRVGARGIYLTTDVDLLAFPLSLATNFWVAWLFDRVTDVRHTHYEENPALLIRTRFNPRGTILPISRTDAEPVALFLKPSSTESGANAFS